MIFIQSRQTDVTTIRLIKWLIHYNKAFFRLNFDNEFERVFELLDSSKMTSGYFHGKGILRQIDFESSIEINLQLQRFLAKEQDILYSAVQNHDSLKKKFGNSLIGVNKIVMLGIASKVGFDIPEYAIVCSKEKVTEYMEQWGRVICKSIDDGWEIETDSLMITGQRTEELTIERILNIPHHFYPTMIQKLITKEIELRVFYFNGQIRGLATIIEDIKSHVDIRAESESNEYRKVPFAINKNFKTKIERFMELCGLNYGSLDFIISTTGRCYFLEVNPYGQYGYVSQIGNYYLEKSIAEYL